MARRDHLFAGNVKSCGCLRNRQGGLSQRDGKSSPEWNSYHGAKVRCSNPRQLRWKDYGGRGIEFKFQSFKEFYDELGPRPSGHSLDRIDVNGHYEKGNVRWASAIVQANNTRRKSVQ